MEQRISYISIYYGGHLQKCIAIFDATGTNFLKQKQILMKTMFIMNTAIWLK